MIEIETPLLTATRISKFKKNSFVEVYPEIVELAKSYLDLNRSVEIGVKQQREVNNRVEAENTELREVNEKLSYQVIKYYEYFKAIESGEYNNNRRSAPLRVFEEIIQDAALRTIELYDKTIKKLGDQIKTYPTVNRGESCRCRDCGNLWWFDKGIMGWVCTTCYKTHGKS